MLCFFQSAVTKRQVYNFTRFSNNSCGQQWLCSFIFFWYKETSGIFQFYQILQLMSFVASAHIQSSVATNFCTCNDGISLFSSLSNISLFFFSFFFPLQGIICFLFPTVLVLKNFLSFLWLIWLYLKAVDHESSI